MDPRIISLIQLVSAHWKIGYSVFQNDSHIASIGLKMIGRRAAGTDDKSPGQNGQEAGETYPGRRNRCLVPFADRPLGCHFKYQRVDTSQKQENQLDAKKFVEIRFLRARPEKKKARDKHDD